MNQNNWWCAHIKLGSDSENILTTRLSCGENINFLADGNGSADPPDEGGRPVTKRGC